MPPNVKVCINGFVLSTLLFDCANNNSDQEGFLYGSITRNVRREISDHSMSNTQEEILISVCSSVPSGSFLSFYNNVGEIKREDLEYNLCERAEVQNIVGWYRFRRYSAMFPSVREQSTHRNLRDVFNNWDRLVDTSYFVFGILSSSNLPNFATHSYDYGFFVQRRDGTFKDLPLTILNLGDTRNSYRSGSMALPFMNSSSFNSVLSSSWNFDTFFDTENQIHEFHQRLRAKLDSLQEELAASDAVNASLEDDIKRISNEMQTLLAAQERIACAAAEAAAAEAAAAAAARESEQAEICIEINKEENTDAFKKSNESRETEIHGVVVQLVANKILPQVNEMVEGVNPEVREVIEACKIATAASVDNETIMHNQKYDFFNGNVDHGNNKENEPREYNKNVESNCSKEKAENLSGLKRTSTFPYEEDRSIKRACPDKYFETGEYLDDKLEEKPVGEIKSTVKLEDNALSTCNEKIVDMDTSELASQKNDDMFSDISSCVSDEPKMPSPASNVEIIVSDIGLQSFESSGFVILSAFMINCIISLVIYGLFCSSGFHRNSVYELISSPEELSDTRESDTKEAPSLVSASKSPEISEKSKSLSDSEITCKTEVLTSSRCGSAPAKFLSHLNSSTGEKVKVDESISKNSCSNQSTSRIKPPFIVYACKKLDNEPVPISAGSLNICESKPEESFKDKIVDESCQSPPKDKKHEQKSDDVPQESVKKVE